MSELEKKAAKEFLSAAQRIPADLRPAAMEKANTYMAGLSDMAALLAPPKEPPKEES